jgi:hypothetical protein
VPNNGKCTYMVSRISNRHFPLHRGWGSKSRRDTLGSPFLIHRTALIRILFEYSFRSPRLGNASKLALPSLYVAGKPPAHRCANVNAREALFAPLIANICTAPISRILFRFCPPKVAAESRILSLPKDKPLVALGTLNFAAACGRQNWRSPDFPHQPWADATVLYSAPRMVSQNLDSGQ